MQHVTFTVALHQHVSGFYLTFTHIQIPMDASVSNLGFCILHTDTLDVNWTSQRLNHQPPVDLLYLLRHNH